jgi:hypothetical protein
MQIPEKYSVTYFNKNILPPSREIFLFIGDAKKWLNNITITPFLQSNPIIYFYSLTEADCTKICNYRM